MSDFITFLSTNAVTGEVTETVHYLTPEEKADIEAQEAAAKLTQSVSMRQARLALLQSGLLATVEAAIATGSEADQITWEYATEVRRGDPLVVNLSASLGLTEQQLDDLFKLAATL